MISYLTDDFFPYYRKLPKGVKKTARKNYRLWKKNPTHPSLQFKQIHTNEMLYSIRTGKGWRALGLRNKNNIYWFWIGSHAEYEKLISQW